MANMLPNKLMLLRKYYGYSQADVAQKLDVTVQEYMGWENGSLMCSIQQLKKLAGIFGVSLDDMIVNSDDIDLPEKETEETTDDITIPFQKLDQEDEMQQTIESPFIQDMKEEYANKTIDVVPADELDETEDIQIPSNENDFTNEEEFQKTIKTKIVDDDQYREKEDSQPTVVMKQVHEEPKVVKKPVKAASVKKKKKVNTEVIIGIAVALVVVIGVVFFLTSKGKTGSTVAMTTTNRLAAADTFSLYIDDTGNTNTHGTAGDVSEFTGLVQVSARDTFALGLKKDGSVVCTGSSTACDVEKWQDIKMIAAGASHSVGLKNDGTVECVGSTTGCEVSEWKDIERIYAGNEITIGIDKNGDLKFSGLSSSSAQLTQLKNVKDIAISDAQFAVVKSDGTVATYSVNGASVLFTGNMSGVSKVALGDDFVVGLTSNGSVFITSDDEDLVKEVEEWKNVKYIAANGSYVVGITNDKKMVGAGNNAYGQYENSTSETTPTPSADADKLGTIGNVKFTANTKTVTASWTPVVNADYYQVTIAELSNYTAKTQQASLSIDTSKLVNGSKYTLSIVSCSNKDTFEDSDPFTVAYTYTEVTASPTPTPQFTITFKNWDGSELAKSSVDAGTTPTYSGTPTRSATGQTCTFTGWSPAITPVTANATYTAQFSCKNNAPSQYTATFKNWDGSQLLESKVDVNTVPSYNGTPTRPEDANNTYEFTGWSPALTAITKDTVYTAQFKAVPKAKSYTVTVSYVCGSDTIKPQVAETFTEGSSYNFPPAIIDGYSLNSPDSCSGVVTSDVSCVYYYDVNTIG